MPVSQISIPYIQALHFTVPALYVRRFHLDRRPDFDERDVSGIMDEPPVVGHACAALAPAVDVDGNSRVKRNRAPAAREPLKALAIQRIGQLTAVRVLFPRVCRRNGDRSQERWA